MNNQDYSRKINDNSEDKILSITSDFKNRRLQILQHPTNSVPRKAKVAKRNPDTARLWNDYVSQIATRKNKPPSATLFSSKDEHSASKTEISSTAGKHGPKEAGRHLSTQARHDAGLGVDLHRTVAGRARKINPELLDEGTHPTSQDFLQLPPRTSKYMLLRD